MMVPPGAEVRDIDSVIQGGPQYLFTGRSLYLFAINGYFYFAGLYFTPSSLRSTSSGGETLMTALYWGGQATRQLSHLTHFSWLITFILSSLLKMASTGQLPTQASQDRSHLSGSI